MKKKLSILIYSLANGGAERVVSILLQELNDVFDITLFLMNDTIFYDIDPNINIIYLERSNAQEHGLLKLLKLPILAWKYKRLNQSDISLSFMYRANYINVIAKFFGMNATTIINERNYPSAKRNQGLQGAINLFLIKRLYKHADHTLTNSLVSTHDLNYNFKVNKISTIYNPINLDQILTQYNASQEPKNNTFTFITIGSLTNQKNHRLMIQAMKDISARLLIIGDGILYDDLALLISKYQLNDKVILLGRQKNPFQFLSNADCFLFTSNHEGFPNVLIEALACQLPIISTDCLSGPREILAPDQPIHTQLDSEIEIAKHGILTPINNKKLLIDAMTLIIQNQHLRDQYSTNSKKRANDFNMSKIMTQYQSILTS